MYPASPGVEADLVTIVDDSGDGFSAPSEPVISSQARSRETCFLSTILHSDIASLSDGIDRDITVIPRINDIWHLNSYFRTINDKLLVGGFYIGCAHTSEQIKRETFDSYSRWIAFPYYILLFVINRILPKLKITWYLYYVLTRGRNRMLSKAEILGRLVYCGFDIVDYQLVGRDFFFVVQKSGLPERHTSSPSGLLFKMKRVGKNGKLTYVYKLRTMHPYAEYLQSYVYENCKLQDNGKFVDDFRIATWGRVLRRFWIDEIPMLINLLKGELKLVGVRPISEHYMSLYPEEIVNRRKRHKPGLIPPFYADMPVGFDGIVESEKKYMQAYEEHPFVTDCRYLCCCLYNIIFRHARSC